MIAANTSPSSRRLDDTDSKDMPGFTPICIVVVASVQAVAAGLVTLFGGVLATGIVEDKVMLFACITGAVGGSFVSICFFPPKNPSVQAMTVKFLASGVFSMVFSPLIIERWFTATPSLVLFISGMMGLTAFLSATLMRRKWAQWVADRGPDDRG
jgi:hypothetical protein